MLHERYWRYKTRCYMNGIDVTKTRCYMNGIGVTKTRCFHFVTVDDPQHVSSHDRYSHFVTVDNPQHV